MVEDGVTWKPFWEFNYRDKQDVIILWRSPKALDFDLNCENIYLDLHDVIPAGEFNEKRLAKLTKVFLKTKAHRDVFPNIPDEKIAIVPNGIDTTPFEKYLKTVKKDPYLIINTSSADRSMDIAPEIFKRVKARVPQAKMKWAYGWGIYDQTFEHDRQKLDWKQSVNKAMEESGIENLGKINQDEVAKLYCEAGIFLYPTEFYEIDCISAKKAQLGGAYPITTNFAALNESVQFGDKIHSEKTKSNWAKDFQFHFGVETEEQIDAFVERVVEKLGKEQDITEMTTWAKKFDWQVVGNKWQEVLKCGKI
jgi:glycosyltransferase involved in cell wall biosynthesis